MLYQELIKILSTNPQIIDLRDKDDFDTYHLPNSINIDHTDLIINHHKYLKENIPYYLICDKGVISQLTANKLKDFNYTLIVITDGILLNS